MPLFSTGTFCFYSCITIPGPQSAQTSICQMNVGCIQDAWLESEGWVLMRLSKKMGVKGGLVTWPFVAQPAMASCQSQQQEVETQ